MNSRYDGGVDDYDAAKYGQLRCHVCGEWVQSDAYILSIPYNFLCKDCYEKSSPEFISDLKRRVEAPRADPSISFGQSWQ